MGILLDQFLNKYAYTDFHELNADWMIRTMISLISQVEDFVSLNAVKYADPIQWNIISQYEKNTIVIDPQTGTAYISVQPVPSGVTIYNTDYWTEVFSLDHFITAANNNFTLRVDNDTLTSTYTLNVGDWIIWNYILYKANATIIPGDQYVEGSNIIRLTVEEVVQNIYDYFHIYIGALSDLNTTDKTNIVYSINETLTYINDICGYSSELLTTDKNNLVHAINEVLTTLSLEIGDLNNLATSDKTSVVNAINETLNYINDICGDRAELLTDDKNNLVHAINELSRRNILSTHKYIFVGDSYGTVTYNWVNSFVGYAGIPATNYYNACVAGYGFNRGGYNGFLEELQTAYGAVDDPDEINDIIIIGGINDTDSTWDFGGELTAIANTATYIATYFPNASVYIGFVGGMEYDSPLYTDPANTQNNDIIPKIVECWKISGGFKWHYINNIENIYKWHDNISSDGLHPTANGANAIGIALTSALAGVSTTLTHYESPANVTINPLSSGSFSGTPTLTNYFVDNNLTTFDLNDVNLINISVAPNSGPIPVLSIPNMLQRCAKKSGDCSGTATGFIALIDSNNVTRFKMCTFNCQFYNGNLTVDMLVINDAGSGYESDQITAINIPYVKMFAHTMIM